MKILHIAPLNTSGVPIAFVRAERELGHHSRLVTLARDRRNYEEDICLDLPFIDFMGTRLAKRFVSAPERLTVSNRRAQPGTIPAMWQPNGLPEKLLVRLREAVWRPRISHLFREIDFWDFDLYQLDGGLEFFRDGRTVRELVARGKRVICCYTGSDLRTRGVIPAIDALVHANVTLEFDHLELHPSIHHVFFPFDTRPYSKAAGGSRNLCRIGHAPTNRQAKGSDQIIAVIQELQQEHNVELVLIENLSHQESLELKSGCDIFVDQLGELGYGLNSLESLAMGIATCSALASGFAEKYSDHPFIEVTEATLKTQLTNLIADLDLRTRVAAAGPKWVAQNHNSLRVVQRIHSLANVKSADLT